MTNDDFPHERWFDLERFDGYGTIDVVRHDQTDCLTLKPSAPLEIQETHAALVISAREYADFDATFADVVTLEQLRRNDAPNPWERAWLIWHFTDRHHFYYFILKNNGWELGKTDPAYPGGQRFLATGEHPRFPLGATNTVRVRQHGCRMSIDVDGKRVIAFADDSVTTVPGSAGWYPAGRFGFYCEDAYVRFGGFRLNDEGADSR